MQPSVQLVGGTPPRDIDLGTLRAMGVRIAGRTRGAPGRLLHLADDLPEAVGRCDGRAARILARAAQRLRPWPGADRPAGGRHRRRRSSNFIGGVGADAIALATEAAGHLAHAIPAERRAAA
jgi:hypothetical protein